MKTPDNDLLRLKNEITKVYREPIEYPTDCDTLATVVIERTKRNISSSTLKRIFGFVKRSSNFSRHTYDTLAKFIGYDRWTDFTSSGKQQEVSTKMSEFWEQLINSASALTTNHLNFVKENSGIIFEHVYIRNNINDTILNLIQTMHTITALVAPAGYGKTVGTAKMFESNFFHAQNLHSRDVVCYIQTDLIVEFCNPDFNFQRWLQNKLGYGESKDIFEILDKNPFFKSGNFYMFIDLPNKPIDFNSNIVFLNNFLDFLSKVMVLKWVKVMLCCRPGYWQYFVKYFNIYKSLKLYWQKNKFEIQNRKNITDLLLNEKEISEIKKSDLNSKYNIDSFKELDIDLQTILKYPYMLQIHIGENNRRVNSETEIVYRHIKQYLLSKNNNHEFDEFLILLIQSMDLCKRNFVLKSEITGLIQKYPLVYNELICEGTLWEDAEFDNLLNLLVKISFDVERIALFFAALYWCRKYSPNEDIDYTEYVEYYRENPEIGKRVAKWISKIMARDLTRNVQSAFSAILKK